MRPADSGSCWPCVGFRRPTRRSRSSPPNGRRWRWRWWGCRGCCPVGEGGIGGDDTRALVAVTRGDDLIEEIGSVLVERQVAKFVADKQSRLGIDFQLTDQRVIDLRGQQVIEHIHGGGEED